MSLFKTRDWWSASVGEDEEFDHGCLCTANIDNDVSGNGIGVFTTAAEFIHQAVNLLVLSEGGEDKH